MTSRSLIAKARRRVLGAPPAVLRGRLDGVNAKALGGWASFGAAPVSVELRHGDLVVAQAAARTPRPDVEDSGQGPLACGFVFDVAQIAETLRRADGGGVARPLRIFVDGTELPGATGPLTADDVVGAAALVAAA